jgi:hypothetical protein
MLPKPTIGLLFLALLGLSSCKSKEPEPEGYRVTSYDGNTHEWTIIRTGTFDGKFQRKRLIVICNFFVWGNRRPVDGPEACHLDVGRLIVPHLTSPKDHPESNVDVFEMPDQVLSITEGIGDDHTTQQFRILKYELLPDSEN